MKKKDKKWRKVVKKLPHFYVRVLPDDRYEWKIYTKGASFSELSQLLSCLELIKLRIVDHLDSIEPEIDISEEVEE